MYDRIPEPPIEPPYREENPVCTCSWCGEGIFEGEEYTEIGSEYFHAECLSNEMSIYELLDKFGCSVSIAARE